jgi:hypothetical protein
MVHGGDAGFRSEDGIEVHDMVRNTYGISNGSPLFGEVLDRYLDSQRFEVLAYQFPNAINAQYTEWKRFFEQILASQDLSGYKSIILIGHSLGTVFLQRYVSTEYSKNYTLSISQLHLIGCCWSEGNFEICDAWTELQNLVESIYLYHSKDDPICDYSEAERYFAHLPHATFTTYENLGHMEVEQIPELIEHIGLIT